MEYGGGRNQTAGILQTSRVHCSVCFYSSVVRAVVVLLTVCNHNSPHIPPPPSDNIDRHTWKLFFSFAMVQEENKRVQKKNYKNKWLEQGAQGCIVPFEHCVCVWWWGGQSVVISCVCVGKEGVQERALSTQVSLAQK